MALLVEFTIEPTDFVFAELVTPRPESKLEFERVVPAGDDIVPFVWVNAPDRQCETALEACQSVQAADCLDRIDGWRLYRVTWSGEIDVLTGIWEHDGALLEARFDQVWVIRVRFPDHTALAAFHSFLLEHDIEIQLSGRWPLREKDPGGTANGLTPAQREALELALRNGYFETPSRVNLDDLAAELGISQQALSKRLRHGTKTILQNALPACQLVP